MTSTESLFKILQSMPYDEFKRSLQKLPDIERSILRMIIEGKTQIEIAKKLDLSQPSVSYRITLAVNRIRFKQLIPSKNTAAKVMEDYGVIPENQEAVLAFLDSENQSDTARKMDRTQGWVRHRISRVVDDLKGTELAKALQMMLPGKIPKDLSGEITKNNEGDEVNHPIQLAYYYYAGSVTKPVKYRSFRRLVSEGKIKSHTKDGKAVIRGDELANFVKSRGGKPLHQNISSVPPGHPSLVVDAPKEPDQEMKKYFTIDEGYKIYSEAVDTPVTYGSFRRLVNDGSISSREFIGIRKVWGLSLDKLIQKTKRKTTLSTASTPTVSPTAYPTAYPTDSKRATILKSYDTIVIHLIEQGLYETKDLEPLFQGRKRVVRKVLNRLKEQGCIDEVDIFEIVKADNPKTNKHNSSVDVAYKILVLEQVRLKNYDILSLFLGDEKMMKRVVYDLVEQNLIRTRRVWKSLKAKSEGSAKANSEGSTKAKSKESAKAKSKESAKAKSKSQRNKRRRRGGGSAKPGCNINFRKQGVRQEHTNKVEKIVLQADPKKGISSSKLVDKCGGSSNQMYEVLLILIKEGKVKSWGKARATRYCRQDIHEN